MTTDLQAQDFKVLSLHSLKQSVVIDGTPVPLSPTEFRIMAQLIKHQGKLVSRDELLEVIWGNAETSKRALDPHMTSLRRKMRATRGAIKTAYGKGYWLMVRESSNSKN